MKIGKNYVARPTVLSAGRRLFDWGIYYKSRFFLNEIFCNLKFIMVIDIIVIFVFLSQNGFKDFNDSAQNTCQNSLSNFSV